MTGRMIAPLLFGLIGTAILLWLGFWQLERLAWKEAVIAEIETRIEAPPVPLPAAPSEAADEYQAVALEGRSTGDEILVLVSVEGLGTGYRVIVPFETGGRRILLDRGFIGERARNQTRPPVSGRASGNLLWPDEVDSFTPPPEGDLWFARDLPAMAKALNTEPVLVVLSGPEPAEGAPRPLPIGTKGIANNHLNYAITWFLLAIGWMGMTGYWLWRIRRQTDQKGA